jgi:predicted TIM-barrel fold metal-dependent hydrolase
VNNLIIDTQVHVFRKLANLPWKTYPPERLVDDMKRAGVDKAILISYEPKDILPSVGWNPAFMDVDKEYFIQAYLKYPDKFIWYTDHINPANKDYIKEVEKDVERGAKGIKMFPAVSPSVPNEPKKTGTLPDDPRYNVLYKKCGELGLPIIMAFEHWNDPTLGAYIGQDYDKFLSHVEPVAKNFENVDFLLTHWGCFNWGPRAKECSKPPFPGLQSFVKLLNKYDNLYTDIAAISTMFAVYNNEDWPYPIALKMLEELIKGVGIEKVMWATDWPWMLFDEFCTYKQTITMIQHGCTFLNEREKQMLLGDNAAKFLGLK